MNVDIEEIKQMKQKGFLGWSKYLLPYCREYFDAGYSIAQVKDKLITLYGFDLSNETLSRMRLKYRKTDLVPPKAEKSGIIAKGSLQNHSINRGVSHKPSLSKLERLEPQIKILLIKGVSLATIAKVLEVTSLELKEFLLSKKLRKPRYAPSNK